MSKQTNIVREIKKLIGQAEGEQTSLALGGNVLLATPQHSLDGPEHLEPTDTTDKNATAAHHGLLPKLSGDASEHLAGDGSWSDAGAVSPPENPFDGDHPRGVNLTKLGVVIERGGSGAWDEALVESPSLFFDPISSRYGMTYTGYDGTDTASADNGQIGIAWSDSPGGPWVKEPTNPLFSGSGAGPDAAGVTGSFVWWEFGTYYLFYIGFTGAGLEGGVKSLCLATATDLFGSWTFHGAIISPTTGWRDIAIYHPNIVKWRGLYYLFFNASDGTNESIGYATSDDLLTWTVDDVNSPILEPDGWSDMVVGDPYVYRLGETWWMAYYGAPTGWTLIADGLAWTSDDEFPLNWRKLDDPVLEPGPDAFDDHSAGRPCIWISPTAYHHYYTTGDSVADVREIALAVEYTPGGSAAPSGPAGGDLSGTYPNPSVVNDSHSHTSATAPAGITGEILISDTPSTPLIFADLIQNEAQDDLVYADP